MKSLLLKAGMVVISMLVALLIAEVVTRWLYEDVINLFPRYHSQVAYGPYEIRRLRPETVFWHTSIDGKWRFQTNKQGYRDIQDWDYRRDSNVVRVVVLGDSHTLGFEVAQDQTYAAVLQGLLTSKGIAAEVLNMGVSGFGTDEQLITLEYEGLKYQPDYVVIGFFANDFEDNVKTGLFVLDADTLVVNSFENLPGVKILDRINDYYVMRKLSEESYLYSLAFNTVWDTVKRLRIQQARDQVTQAEPRDDRSYAIATKSRRSDYEIKITGALLKKIFDLCRSHNIRPIFVDIPQHTLEASLDPALEGFIAGQVDFFLRGKELVSDGQMVAHVPNGQRHISHAMHRRIAEEIAGFIAQQKTSLKH